MDAARSRQRLTHPPFPPPIGLLALNVALWHLESAWLGVNSYAGAS
jgi:hypothetical protein